MSSRLAQFVRQEIPPPIRPPPPQPAVAEAADDTGFAVLSGSSGRCIDLSSSSSANFARSREKEVKRKVARVRVKQKVKDPTTGEETVNEENYVDLEVTEGLLTRHLAHDELVKVEFAKQAEADNIEILEQGVWLDNPEAPKPTGEPPVYPDGGAP